MCIILAEVANRHFFKNALKYPKTSQNDTFPTTQ